MPAAALVARDMTAVAQAVPGPADGSHRLVTGVGTTDPYTDFSRKLRKIWELALHPPLVPVGQTPNDVVYTDGRMVLRHYRRPSEIPVDQDRPPILLIYALINRPYILDLQPGLSVVEDLLRKGLDVYLIDWGTPNELDKDHRIHDYVNGYIDRALDVVRERSGVDRPHVLGYCMGGTFAAMYTARHPEKVGTLSLMAAGIDFDTRASFLNIWARAPGFDARKIARTYGLIPAEFFNAGFALLDPLRTNYLKFRDLIQRIDDPAYVENFLRMEKWNIDGIPMAGPTYAEFIEKGYQKNLLVKGEWTLDGDRSPIDLAKLTMPMATIVGLKDNLMPPECTERIIGHVKSRDVRRFEQPSGHIGVSVGRSAHRDLWPQYADWVLAHSPVDSPGARTRRSGPRRVGRPARRSRH